MPSNGRSWTKEEHEVLIRMAGNDATAREIGNAIGRSKASVIAHAGRVGVPLTCGMNGMPGAPKVRPKLLRRPKQRKPVVPADTPPELKLPPRGFIGHNTLYRMLQKAVINTGGVKVRDE